MEVAEVILKLWVEIVASTGTQSAGDFLGKNKALGMAPGFAKSGLGALETSSNYL
jgi:uncharacterized membrane-anchored protein